MIMKYNKLLENRLKHTEDLLYAVLRGMAQTEDMVFNTVRESVTTNTPVEWETIAIWYSKECTSRQREKELAEKVKMRRKVLETIHGLNAEERKAVSDYIREYG